MSEAFVYFVTGMAIGVVVGVMTMAIILAIGRNQEETD